MKPNQIKLVLAACLASSPAMADTPEVGGVSGSLGAVSASAFSPTTKLNSEVLFRTRSILGENDVGEAALLGYDGLTPLDLSGDGGFQFNFQGVAGYNDNVGEFLVNEDESYYLALGGSTGHAISNGPLDIVIGVAGGLTYYEEDLHWREDDEHWVGDLGASAGATYRPSDKTAFKAFTRVYHGSNASPANNFVKGGVTPESYFLWDVDVAGDIRTGQGALGQRGFEISGGISLGGLASDGNSEMDNFNLQFRGEGRYNLNEDTSSYIVAHYGHRDFNDFRPMGMSAYSVESRSFSGGGGVRVNWGSTASWNAEAGVEQREYDDLPSTGSDERTEFYINGELNVVPHEDIAVAIFMDYGIQNVHINEYPMGSFIDPIGLRTGAKGRWQWSDDTALLVDMAVTWFEGSEVLDQNLNNTDFFRWHTGLEVNHKVKENIELFARGNLLRLDNDHERETYVNGSVGVRGKY